MEQRPEIANMIQTGNFKTNYHDVGNKDGEKIVLLHGSGPGVTAWANWNKLFTLWDKDYHMYAPDMVGFGYTERPAGISYNMNVWVQQTIDFFDAAGIEKANLIGNSFGGALALSIAIKYPERVNKLILMGSMGVSFPITYGLDRVWGYQPSLANMEELLEIFTYDHSFVTPDLIKTRYESSKKAEFHESFSSMFPEPRQNSVEAMAGNKDYIRDIPHDTLVVHGREDRVIPVETSLELAKTIKNSELHIFGKCGHWTQIEQTQRFADTVKSFIEK
ncbi:alpha/beta fold hydrolase [Enterococcus sp. BWR-S5]|uniref:alpha/beta fold hydrolase n=1 Tax=Enterococcus sp. BWR-S5 TaxID=2787714 RepID=UPI00192307F3|nr:alpha/beta hydrolase [Enterococcus sp. BWR-S5]MBL1223616.1 alpha/beta fold hydrolase [Enterococcus sp. BWR-S5]